MKKYQCSICGYIYDEEKEGVRFSDLPDDWKCPLCGAPKDMFVEIAEENSNVKEESKTEVNDNIIEESEDLRELSNAEIAYICSNLAKACEKQYLENEQKMFQDLYEYFDKKIVAKEGNINDVSEKIDNDINMFNEASKVADEVNDSGAKRVITWASKTSNLIKTILNKYQNSGVDYIKNTKIWVCDICGFIYVGDEPPKVCPICKVPNFKIMEVK